MPITIPKRGHVFMIPETVTNVGEPFDPALDQNKAVYIEDFEAGLDHEPTPQPGKSMQQPGYPDVPGTETPTWSGKGTIRPISINRDIGGGEHPKPKEHPMWLAGGLVPVTQTFNDGLGINPELVYAPDPFAATTISIYEFMRKTGNLGDDLVLRKLESCKCNVAIICETGGPLMIELRDGYGRTFSRTAWSQSVDGIIAAELADQGVREDVGANTPDGTFRPPFRGLNAATTFSADLDGDGVDEAFYNFGVRRFELVFSAGSLQTPRNMDSDFGVSEVVDTANSPIRLTMQLESTTPDQFDTYEAVRRVAALNWQTRFIDFRTQKPAGEPFPYVTPQHELDFLGTFYPSSITPVEQEERQVFDVEGIVGYPDPGFPDLLPLLSVIYRSRYYA